MARPRGARAHGPSRLGSIRTRRLRMRRGGNGSLHPPPPGTPARRASGVAHDPSRVWGAQDDVRGRHGPVPTAHRPLDRRGARRTLLPRAAVQRPRVLPVDRQSDRDRRRGCARAQHPRRLHRPDLHRPRSLHVGRRRHGRARRRRRRHPLTPHQRALPGDRHARGPAHHRVDHQPRHVDLGRRPGVDRDAAPGVPRCRDRVPAWDVFFPDVLRRARGRRHPEPAAEPDRPGLHRDPRSRHRRGDHRDQHLPLQAPRVRDLVVLRGVTGVLYTYYLGIANYEQFQITVSIDYLAMIIIGGLGSVLGSVFGAIFVTLLPIAIRYAMEALGGLVFSQASVLNIIPNLRLILFGALIIFFLVVEPEGLNRLWRNIRNYFRVWPFAY